MARTNLSPAAWAADWLPRWQPFTGTAVPCEQMYVYPPRLLGRNTSETPFGRDDTDEYLTPKTNPQGRKGGLGFSDGLTFSRRQPTQLAGRTCRIRGRIINSCVFFPSFR